MMKSTRKYKYNRVINHLEEMKDYPRIKKILHQLDLKLIRI
jgi:hypothetical protein